MGVVVSLKLHRKRRERTAKADASAENRAKSGRTKTEKSLTAAGKEKSAKDLDSHKREE